MALFNKIFGSPGGGLNGLLQNPAFMGGVGLLGSPSNQMGGLLGGLAAAQGYKLSEAKLAQEAEQEKRKAELQAMQMQALKQAQEREAVTKAMLQSASMQAGTPGGNLLQSPENQAMLRSFVAANGVPQMAEQGGLLAPLPNSENTPAELKLFEAAKNNPQLMEFLNRNKPDVTPSAIREAQMVAAMSPEQQKLYFATKRAGNVFDVGGVPNYLPSGGPAVASPVQLATPEAVAANKEMQAAGAAAGTETGKAQAQAQIDLPKVRQDGEYMLSLLEGLKNDPGKSYAVGASSVLPIMPGTTAAGFKARLKQIEGAQFLQAYETLKGSGQITEVEGEKATSSIARMSRAQREQDFDAAVDEFAGIVRQLMSRAAAKAGGGVSTPIPGSRRLKYNPVSGEFE